MSFTKLSYDKGAYTSNLNQSVGPGVYRLGEPTISCEQCYPLIHHLLDYNIKVILFQTRIYSLMLIPNY